MVGLLVGVRVGSVVGLFVGLTDGSAEGSLVGCEVGSVVGTEVTKILLKLLIDGYKTKYVTSSNDIVFGLITCMVNTYISLDSKSVTLLEPQSDQLLAASSGLGSESQRVPRSEPLSEPRSDLS